MRWKMLTLKAGIFHRILSQNPPPQRKKIGMPYLICSLSWDRIPVGYLKKKFILYRFLCFVIKFVFISQHFHLFRKNQGDVAQ